MDTATIGTPPGNRTKARVQPALPSVVGRDGILDSGMERGVRDSHERLDELLKTMRR